MAPTAPVEPGLTIEVRDGIVVGMSAAAVALLGLSIPVPVTSVFESIPLPGRSRRVLRRGDGTKLHADVEVRCDGARTLIAIDVLGEVRGAELLSGGVVDHILESLPIGVYVLNADHQPVYANLRAVEILGRGIVDTSDEMAEVHTPMRGETGEPYPVEDYPIVRALAGEAVVVDDMVITADGRQVPLQVWGHPVFDDDGGIPMAIAAFLDITERREAERRRSEVEQRMRQLSRRAGRSEVAAGVLHNVGNVMTGVVVSAETVRERIADNPAGSRLERVARLFEEADADFLGTERGQASVRYLSGIATQLSARWDELRREVGHVLDGVEHVRQILQRQQQEGRVQRLPGPFLLRGALEQVVDMASTWEHGLEIVLEGNADFEMISLQHVLIEVLVNLVKNAIEATVAVSRTAAVRLRTRRLGGEVEISVADGGGGVPDGLRSRLFQQGFTTKADGHGIGLHMSALAAQGDLDGTLWLEETSPEGSTFALRIPLTLETRG